MPPVHTLHLYLCEIRERVDGTLEHIQLAAVLPGDGEAEPLVAAGHIALEAAAGERAAQCGITRRFAFVADKHGVVVVCGFVQQAMLKAVVQYGHINAAREQIGGHTAVVLKPRRQKKFRLGPFGFRREHRPFFMGSRNAALLIDELHGVRKFHIFNFDKILQRVDAAHLVM